MPTIFVYDGYPGGAGHRASSRSPTSTAHVHATAELVAACPCDAGCPSCVQSPKCGNWNEYLDKDAARRLLELLARALSRSARDGAGVPSSTDTVKRPARRRRSCAERLDRHRVRVTVAGERDPLDALAEVRVAGAHVVDREHDALRVARVEVDLDAVADAVDDAVHRPVGPGRRRSAAAGPASPASVRRGTCSR